MAITAANVTDANVLSYVCPHGGAVYEDKGYCTKHVGQELARRGCHNDAILKNNMKDKYRDKDR